MISAALGEALRGIVGADHVRIRDAERAAYATDGLTIHHATPGLVVLPGSRAETIAVVRALHAAKVAFVARGAGTGLSGGALARPDTVLLVLTRLNRIISVDMENRRAVVEPGVVNQALNERVREHQLQFAPDPSSQVACTIGGNVAENAGGPHCLKYGVTTNHVTALDVLLPDGSTATLGSPQGEAWGPDLVGLFTGSEGTFGIALSITVRLVPLPLTTATLLAGFPSVRAAGQAVSDIIAAGVVPSALEMMDQACVQVVEASIYAAGYPTDAAAVLLCELDGADATVADDLVTVERILKDAGVTSLRHAATPAEREKLWRGRKRAFGAMGRLGRDMAVQDAVVPRSALPEILDRIGQIRDRYGLIISNVFHAGDGNLHPNISFDSRDPELSARVRLAGHDIMAACLELGGTITGEHGVGLDKIDWMPKLFDVHSLELMCAVRRVFDPNERANPGKVLPVHSCREWVAGGVV